MPEISLAVQQFNAPGVFISQDFAGALPSGIVPFNNAYLFGEVSSLVSTSLTSGIPYNVPIQITSLEDFETRLGNGNILAFSAPTFGPTLDTYNSVKTFFRNAASDVAASLFFIRIKPVEGAYIQVASNPVEFSVTDSAGIVQTIYGYPIEINGFRIGRVDFDSLGNATHVGVQVSNATPVAEATEAVLDAIVNNGPIGSSVYARIRPGTVDIIDLYPRVINGPLSINGVDTNTLVGVINGPLGIGSIASYTYARELASDDPSLANPAIEARDYVYAIENALDPTVHQPGFLLAPAAFAKFNPEDRLRVGTALENRASDIDYAWMALVDCAPANGDGIQAHYNLELFDLADQTNLTGLTDPFYIRETQEFYIPDATSDFSIGSLGDPGIAAHDIELPELFTTVTPTVVGTELTAGQIIEASDGNLYVVNSNFFPALAPVDETDPEGTTMPGLISGPLNLVTDTLDASIITTAVAATQLNQGEVINGDQVIGATSDSVWLVTADFTPLAVPIDPNDPVGDASNQSDLLQEWTFYVAEGQILNDNGVLYYVRNSVGLTILDTVPVASLSNGDLDRNIPLAYYQEWVRQNLISNGIDLATFQPSEPESLILGARNILWNATTHDALAREHLMYTSPFGHLAYYAPYVVDIEGFNVPPSSAVAGTALRRYREQGFQEPPAGVIYPLRGVLRPQINITRAHQQASNPTGLNAIRLLPNQGTVIWGARTRSSNPLFRWVNTRIILNVVINSLRGAFDDKIFRAIDGSENLFRQIRGTAEGILYVLWQGQALFGAAPSEAYRVIVNRTNNPDFNLENGKINVDVFVVPVSTLEVISITVTRTAIGQLNVVVNSGGALTGA